MARCGCGGGTCNCHFVAGDNVTIDGSGSAANPAVISAQVHCEDVRPCLSPGPGVAYDPTTGVISADLSEDAGNNIVIRPDGLFVPTGSATVTAGCGLTGDGSAGAPITANTSPWAYPCDLDTNAGLVYCDSTGKLRSEPRGRTFYDQSVVNSFPADVLVPATYPTVVETRSLTITNPDPCRDMFVIFETELDVDITYPPGAGAAYGLPGDEQGYYMHTGTATVTDLHTQLTKVFRGTVPAGGTFTYNLDIALGKGSGGATYNKIQTFIRAFGFML